jgi:hypothetical protein
MGLSRVVPGTNIEIHTAKNGSLNIFQRKLMVLTVPEKAKKNFLKELQKEIKEAAE